MRRPQLIRDRVGLHLVWGDWMASLQDHWGFAHVTRFANLGATRIDVWLVLWLRLERVRRAP